MFSKCFVVVVRLILYVPYLAGVLGDGADDCGIYLNEMIEFCSRTLVQNNEIQAL